MILMKSTNSSFGLLIKNAGVLLFGEIISKPLLFLAMVYLARVLQPDGFGKINFALAIVTYFILLSNMGFSLLGTREIARNPQLRGFYIDNILTLRLSLSLTGIAIIALVSFLAGVSAEMKGLLLVYALGLIPLSLLLDWVFQAHERMAYIAIARIITSGSHILLIFLFIRGPGDLPYVPWCQVAGQAAAAIFLLVAGNRRFHRPRLSFHWSSWREIVRVSLPMGAALFMNQIILNLDTVMIGFLRGSEEVGIYQAAYHIVFFLVVLGNTYFDAVYPVLSRYYKVSMDSLRTIQLFSAKMVMIVGIPLAAGGTLLAPDIIRMTYGAEYQGSVIALRVLLWSVFLILVNNIYSRGLLGCDRQSQFLTVLVVQAGTNILFNFLLIPPLGLLGAAAATVLAEGAGFILYSDYFNKIVRIRLASIIMRPIMATGIMLLGVRWLQSFPDVAVWILAAAGAGIYLLSLFVLGGIPLAEIRHVLTPNTKK